LLRRPEGRPSTARAFQPVPSPRNVRWGGDVDGFTVRPEQWRLWAARFLPAVEPFFFDDARTADALSAAREGLYTRTAPGDSFPRLRVDHGHTYRMWTIDGDSFAWLAGREARERIDPSLWAAIRDRQGANGRGQVYDGSWPLPPVEVPGADRLPDGRFLL